MSKRKKEKLKHKTKESAYESYSYVKKKGKHKKLNV